MTKTQESRTLVLARHAKAEGSATTDTARALSGRGHADAAAMGRWLIEHGHRFDAVICSTSVRTRETWADIEAAGVKADGVTFDERVYAADADALLAVLTEVPDGACDVLVVGHAPTIPELTDALADRKTSDERALADLRSNFPTACCAVLTLNGPWATLTPGAASLTEITAARG